MFLCETVGSLLQTVSCHFVSVSTSRWQNLDNLMSSHLITRILHFLKSNTCFSLKPKNRFKIFQWELEEWMLLYMFRKSASASFSIISEAKFSAFSFWQQIPPVITTLSFVSFSYPDISASAWTVQMASFDPDSKWQTGSWFIPHETYNETSSPDPDILQLCKQK